MLALVDGLKQEKSGNVRDSRLFRGSRSDILIGRKKFSLEAAAYGSASGMGTGPGKGMADVAAVNAATMAEKNNERMVEQQRLAVV